MGWIGGRVFLPGMLAYVPGKKQLRTLAELSAALRDELTVERYESLAGLLNHLVCLLAIPYFIMYGVYAVLDVARGLKLSGADKAPVSHPQAKGAIPALQQWLDTIKRRAGNSMFAAAFDSQLPATGASITRIYQDAARKGTRYHIQPFVATCTSMCTYCRSRARGSSSPSSSPSLRDLSSASWSSHISSPTPPLRYSWTR